MLIFRGRPLWPRTIDTAQEQPDSVIYGVDPHDQFGYYRHSIADLDGDGLNELVSGSDVAEGSHGAPLTGEIRSYQPGPQLKPTVDLRTRTELYISGVNGGDLFAAPIAHGDVNGDGKPDLVTSAGGGDGPDEQRSFAGEIAVWFGRPIWPKTIDRAPGSEDLLIYGAETEDGFYPETVGDLNGDGLDEIFGFAPRNRTSQNETIWMLSPFDLDDDGIAQLPDNCPRLYNPEQADRDHDLIGDLCDNCPDLANVPQLDGDHDGLGDACDLCPDRPGGSSGDQDGDGIDGCVDNCIAIANPDQSDLDLDGTGDACDVCPADALGDVDGDGICALLDNCPERFNPVQRDSDDDGAGDLCELCTLEGINFAYSGIDDLRVRSIGDDAIQLRWSESEGVDLYSVHRGRLSLLSAGSSGECVASDLKSPGWHDTASSVPSGDGWLYLVGTQNLSCAARSAGFDASERARAGEFDACEQTDYHDALAFSEETTLGTRAGNLGATWTPDGTVETLTEQLSPSPPSAPNLRTNLLVHQWWFTVSAGQRIEFHLDAQRDASPDWDNFRFEYSIDAGTTWTELLLGRIPHTFRPLRRVIDVPSTTVGTVLVRVLDTDHTPGAVGLDSIQIDMMKFRTIRPTALP